MLIWHVPLLLESAGLGLPLTYYYRIPDKPAAEPLHTCRYRANTVITDSHIHIQPLHMFKRQALELMQKRRPNFEQIAEFSHSPKAFLKYLDASGIDRAVLINYVAPDVIGFTEEVNQFIADYVKTDPKRLIPCGGIHPRQARNIESEIEQILRLKIRMIKIHPPHQLLFPNDYLNGVKELEVAYRTAEAHGIPVMFHT